MTRRDIYKITNNNFRAGAAEQMRVTPSRASRIARNAGQSQWGDSMAPDKPAISEMELQGYWAFSGGQQVSGHKAGPRGRVPAKKHKQQKMLPGKQLETATNPLNNNRPSGMDLWRRVQDKVQQESHRTAHSPAEQRTQSLGAKRWYSDNGLSRVSACGRTSHASTAQQASNAGTASTSVWLNAYDPAYAIVGGGFGDDDGQDLAAMEDLFRAMQAEGADDDAESVASAARSGILGPTMWQSEEEVKAWASTAWPEWERIFRSKIRPQTRCFWPSVKGSEDEQREEWVLWATGIGKRLKGWARGYLQIAEKVRLARHLALPSLPAGCLVPGSTNAYVTVRGSTGKKSPHGSQRSLCGSECAPNHARPRSPLWWSCGTKASLPAGGTTAKCYG